MKQEREINQLRETTRLENEEQERRWDRKQKEHEFEIDQLRERAKLEYTEMKNSVKITNNSKGSERKNDSNGKENGARK